MVCCNATLRLIRNDAGLSLVYENADVEALTQCSCILPKRDNGVVGADPIRDILIPNHIFGYKKKLRSTET